MSHAFLSAHLSVAEYLATQQRDLLDAQEQAWCADPQLHRNAQRLAGEVFEPVRAALGGHLLHVTSGFRCQALNWRVGGKVNPPSLHTMALAIDVIPTQIHPREALFVLLDEMRKGELRGVDIAIVEMGRWLHLQASRDGKPARQAALETADGTTFARLS